MKSEIYAYKFTNVVSTLIRTMAYASFI